MYLLAVLTLTPGEARSPYLAALMAGPVGRYVANLQTQVLLLSHQGHQIPLTVNHQEFDNSYVCSPYTACVSYAREELPKLQQPLLQGALGLLLDLLGVVLRRASVNRVVHFNNWLYSTNLYPGWGGEGLEGLTADLARAFPTHALLWRSLNGRTNARLMQELRRLGYRLVPSRQVYLFEGDFRGHANTRRDFRLLERSPYRLVPHAHLDDFQRIAHLYGLLYLEKYSRHNPQFTPEMLALMHRHGLWRMTGLADPSGRLDGVVGWFEVEGVMTVPLVGYDTALPQVLGLYRMLMALALKECLERRWLLNLSSGASQFKILRGGQASMEYSALYIDHLPWPRRPVWYLLEALLKGIAAPLLRIFRL